MDGIKKRFPRETEKIKSPMEKGEFHPVFQKKEDLYIRKEENLTYAKHEKALQRGKLYKRIIWLTLFFLASTALAWTTFFLWKTYTAVKKMNVSNIQESTLAQNMKLMISPILSNDSSQKISGESEGRINILLLGAAGEKNPGGNLTDTIIVMSIDVKNGKVALLSLPRDFYTQIPTNSNNNSSSQNSILSENQAFTKINSLYKIGISQQKGAELIKKAVEDIAGIPINRYVVVDFDAFQKIIDDLGGINVQVERDIYDARYPGPNYSYETFSLSKGPHLLDGATALKYVRERHNDPDGDFGRARRQQNVIQAVKNKLFSMQTFFNVSTLSNILDTLSNNIKTDLSIQDIERLIKLSHTLDTQNINNVVVSAWEKDSLLKVSHVTIGNDRAFILVPRVGNNSEIKELAQNIFDQTELKKRQEMIQSESSSIEIINQSDFPELSNKIKKLLSEKLGMKNVTIGTNKTKEIVQTSIISSNNQLENVYTLDELIKKLPVRDSTSEEQTNPEKDITIRLGNDLAEIYKYEEDTLQDLQNADDGQNF